MKAGDLLNITFQIENYTTNSGKQAFSFGCSHCHSGYYHLVGFFYNSNLNKDNLEEALQVFVDSINAQKEMELFCNPRTAKKIREHVCNCDPKIIDFEYLQAVKRAKEICRRAMEIIENQKGKD